MNTNNHSDAVTYDKYGRMNYHPDFHGKQGKPWTTVEEQFLIDSYEAMGAEQVSLALERTIHTVMTRVYKLRKKGLMAKPAKIKRHRRMRQEIN
ncbi:hypothetical protein PL84_03670 [Vibrio anguillarum]|uniref:hypothetical protein n=1 Tax=Vibrio anguillarum TaxID=55601 RepID=UPI00097E2D02|nr:hypothetical protein [Vibrio anguillarum]MBT2909680.1 hypothetical protein [Vibrio anguillarum]MBT2942469.1 hypothetical protein [Vibrio anguillarum]MBT2950707.1 hypothetical protein [Vibrio anguillarum]MBT2979628.1 hypothetical protein [Vibrio anguillarum]